MPAPARQCLSTCAPGGPGLPIGSAATSPHVKTVCSNLKEPSAKSPQGIGYRGQCLSIGHWSRFPRDCELGPELGMFRGVHGCMHASKDVCKDVCIHTEATKDGWVCPKGSILALKELSAIGQVPDKISLQLTCSHFTGAHRRQLNSGS